MIPSIRLRLVLILLVLMGATWIFEAVMTGKRARSEVTAVFDAQLVQAARMLAVTVAHEVDEHDIEGFQRDLQAHEYAYPVVFQVWSATGRLLFFSPDAPAGRFPHEGNDYADITFDGVAWRVLGLRLETGEQVLVAHRVAEREALIREFGGNVIEPLGWSMILAAVLIWLGVQGGLAPLRHLKKEIARRDEYSLEPLHADAYPAEVRDIVIELNSMFVRLDDALQRYGNFTGDAAHELRTPLAGLRIQAQAAERATDETTRRRALDQLKSGIDRTNRLIDQLLTLARIDQECEQEGLTSADIRVVVNGVLVDMQQLAGARGVTLVPPGNTGPAVVHGNADMLAILCRNLVDNAVRYTPRGGEVYVSLDPGADHVALVVEDTGPGIPAEARDAVFERFHRLPGSAGTGSGLGLAIVERIASIHNAQLVVTDREVGSGLRARVIFPLPAATQAPHPG